MGRILLLLAVTGTLKEQKKKKIRLLIKNTAAKQIEASTSFLTLLSALTGYGSYHALRLAFPGFAGWCRHFSTTASNTISLRQKLRTFTFSSLRARNCQIRTKDSLWAHCVTVSEPRGPAGQTACKFIAIFNNGSEKWLFFSTQEILIKCPTGRNKCCIYVYASP